MSDYKIKLEVFEGPIALLMYLIEKDQLDIYDIPIARVTEQYLAYLKALNEFNIDIASEFLVMAATLLQIKSRMLLPKPAQSSETFEQEEEDPRQELVERLLEYRKFKQMAKMFDDLARQREQHFTRQPQQFATQYLLPEGLTLDILLSAFATLWESTVNDYALIDREEISVQNKMQDIIRLLYQHNGKLEFGQTLVRTGTRSEIVAAFLALLELIRLKRVTVRQEKSFAPIYLILREGSRNIEGE